jgi:hypothetical protein
MNNFIFYGNPTMLEELEKFLIGQGLNAKYNAIVRASEQNPQKGKSASANMLSIIESAERVSIAYLAFLESKNPKFKLKFETGGKSLEVSKGDSPEKILGFVQKTKSRFFEIDFTF